jgi:hypothetical protein
VNRGGSRRDDVVVVRQRGGEWDGRGTLFHELLEQLYSVFVIAERCGG